MNVEEMTLLRQFNEIVYYGLSKDKEEQFAEMIKNIRKVLKENE